MLGTATRALRAPEACMLTDPGACPLDIEFVEGDRHCTKSDPETTTLLQTQHFFWGNPERCFRKWFHKEEMDLPSHF